MIFFDLSARDRQDILRTKIPICIIEYETPVYMHLRIGAYIGNWTVEQEEAVRRVLYADKGIYTLQMALRDAQKNILKISDRSRICCVFDIHREFRCFLSRRL